jgi:cell division protein FtsI/penicillin-binding protein 2
MKIKGDQPSGWRDYQRRLKGKAALESILSRIPLLALYSVCAFVIVVLVLWSGSRISGYLGQAGYSPSDRLKEQVEVPKKLTKDDAAGVLRDLTRAPFCLREHYLFENGATRLSVNSSLDPDLQEYISDLLRRSRTLQAAVVVLRPNDGRVLAMVNYSEDGVKENLCLRADFPAASLFKVVSASAALETAGFTPNQTVSFYGRKHTLYKSQLKKRTGRYTSRTSFRKAFASSINPVFGKLGIYDLGKLVMREYADRFLFNREIPFDLPVDVSYIDVPDDNFGLAEVSSGFNKKTLISPLHAALLVSAVANRGIVMAPWFVDRILDESGHIVYKSKPSVLATPISRGTSEDMKVLMRDTVRYGTCRKSFRKIRRKKVFKNVDLGAKTGTINDKTDQYKYDWLAAYALRQNSPKAICIAVLSVHGEKLGIRANELGRYIINHYITS